MYEFGEYVSMFEYTKQAVRDVLFEDTTSYKVLPSPQWSEDFVPWQEENVHTQVVAREEHLTELPIFYNVNFGHATPIGVLPYGVRAKLDCETKTITLLENATE